MQLAHKPYILIVLDGFGYSENIDFNAIHAAKTPTWDRMWAEYPHTLINASGTNVGLPGDQMGNSEVGHMNIGSGRVIRQDFSRISAAIEDGSFFKNEVLVNTCAAVAKNDRAIHIMGLLSDGGVHSQDCLGLAIERDATVGWYLDLQRILSRSLIPYLLVAATQKAPLQSVPLHRAQYVRVLDPVG